MLCLDGVGIGNCEELPEFHWLQPVILDRLDDLMHRQTHPQLGPPRAEYLVQRSLLLLRREVEDTRIIYEYIEPLSPYAAAMSRVLLKALRREFGIGAHPIGDRHTLEQRAVQHCSLRTKSPKRGVESAPIRLEAPSRLHCNQPVSWLGVVKLASSPLLRFNDLPRQPEQSKAGIKLSTEVLANLPFQESPRVGQAADSSRVGGHTSILETGTDPCADAPLPPRGSSSA